MAKYLVILRDGTKVTLSLDEIDVKPINSNQWIFRAIHGETVSFLTPEAVAAILSADHVEQPTRQRQKFSRAD